MEKTIENNVMGQEDIADFGYHQCLHPRRPRHAAKAGVPTTPVTEFGNSITF